MLNSAASTPLAKLWSSDLAAYGLLFALCAIVFCFYGLELPLQRDNAQYLYTAQRWLHGEMPYQSLFDMKTPLTSFFTAFALAVSQPFFDDPIKGMRLIFLGVSIATVLLMYAFARKMFQNRFEALLPPLMMIGLHGFMFQAAIGARPKSLLLLFFVPGLIFLVDKRWFLLGLAAALCAFTWQPSGVLFIAALVYAGIQPASERWSALARLIAGFLIPSFVIFGYFYAHGALKDLMQGAFGVHLYLSRPDENEVWNITKSMPLGFPFAFPLIILGLIGYCAHAVRAIRSNAAGSLSDEPFVPILIMLALFAVGSLLDYQSYEDFFTFLPFAALGIVYVYRVAAKLISPVVGALAVRVAMVATLLVIPLLNVSFSRIMSVNTALWRGGLIEQENAYSALIKGAIGNYDANSNIIVFGLPEIPALLGFRNGTQHSVLGAVHGYDKFIASNYPDGLAGWLSEMANSKPELVIVKTSDMIGYSGADLAAFVDWLNRDFTRVDSNKIARSVKFRSDNIETWIPKKRSL
jgi:hypothetical protein